MNLADSETDMDQMKREFHCTTIWTTDSFSIGFLTKPKFANMKRECHCTTIWTTDWANCIFKAAFSLEAPLLRRWFPFDRCRDATACGMIPVGPRISENTSS